jgi:hypothetical protein
MHNEDILTLESVWWRFMRLACYIVSGKHFSTFRSTLAFQGQVVYKLFDHEDNYKIIRNFSNNLPCDMVPRRMAPTETKRSLHIDLQGLLKANVRYAPHSQCFTQNRA